MKTTKIRIWAVCGLAILGALLAASPAIAVTVTWNFTGGSEPCDGMTTSTCTAAEFAAMPQSKLFNSTSPDATKVLNASAWAATSTANSDLVSAFKLGHYPEGIGVKVDQVDNPRLDKDGKLEFIMFELGRNDYDPLKLSFAAQIETGTACASNPTDCYLHDINLRVWIGGAGPGGSLFSGDGGMQASVDRLNNGTFMIGGAGFTRVYDLGDFDTSLNTIFFCGAWTTAAANATCAANGGVGGTTGRYVVIDWIDAAFLTTFEGQVPGVPEPGTVLLLAAGLAVLAPFARRRR